MTLRKKNQERSSNDTSPRKVVATYSYHNARSDQEASAGRNIKNVGAKHLNSARTLWLEKFGLIILAIAVVASLISIMYVSSSSQVITSGDTNDSLHFDYSSKIEMAASKLITSSILNRDKLTINSSKIDETLEAEFPMYSSISITLPLINHHPVIYVTQSQPAVILNNPQGQYVINEDGKVMLRSSALSSFNSLQIPKVSYPGTSYLNVGQQVLTSSEVQFIQTVVYELSLKGDKVSTMNLIQGTSEINAYISGKTYYVKFNLENNDPRQQAGSFLAAQHYLMTQNITPSQYIDARTDGRVYYQ